MVLYAERIWLTPLSLEQLWQIGGGAAHAGDTPIDPGALSETVHTAMRKKAARMRGVDASLHEWHTYWLIVSRESGQGIGFIGFKGVGEEGFAEVGYGISPLYRRQGLMSEALQALLRWAEESGQAQGVEARVDPDNAGSAGVLRRCGFELTDSSDGEDRYRIQFRR